jgi:pantetheine-phosphate adenylyltransferase, bacterial
MTTAVLTGSFDPVTEGHVKLLDEALKLFDAVHVVMLINPDKVYTFSEEERFSRLKEAFSGYEGVTVAFSKGYAADYVKSVGAELMVRGIRNSADLPYELELRRKNIEYANVDTLLLLAKDSFRKFSSTAYRAELIKERV